MTPREHRRAIQKERLLYNIYDAYMACFRRGLRTRWRSKGSASLTQAVLALWHEASKWN